MACTVSPSSGMRWVKVVRSWVMPPRTEMVRCGIAEGEAGWPVWDEAEWEVGTLGRRCCVRWERPLSGEENCMKCHWTR